MTKVLIFTSLFLLPSVHAVDQVKSMNNYDGKAKVVESIHNSGETSVWLYTEGKAAEELFNILSKNRHVAKVKNSGIDEVWLGEKIGCLKYLKEKSRVLCSQEILRPAFLK